MAFVLKSKKREDIYKPVWFPVTSINGVQADTTMDGQTKEQADALTGLAHGFGEDCKTLHVGEVDKSEIDNYKRKNGLSTLFS